VTAAVAPQLPSSPPHHATLDGLRAIAVLLVLYNHAPQLLGSGGGDDGAVWHGSPGAWLGVDLFFVLSGFLITSILRHGRQRPHALRRFWIRRALRIFPLAYAYLAVLALVGWCVPGYAHLRTDATYPWAASYLLNFHIAWHGWSTAALGILWSLAVEEHFYLLWPLGALRASRRTLVGLLVAMIAFTPLVRALTLPHLGAVGVYVTTFCRWDTLACGALLALAWDSPGRERIRRVASWLAWPSLAVIAAVVAIPVSPIAPTTPTWFHVVGYSAVAGAFTVWCACALDPSPSLRRMLGHPALAAIGRISYGLYVWHVLVAEAIVRALARLHLAPGLGVQVAIWLAALGVVAAASYRWFEAPLLRWKDRLAAA